MYVHVVFAQAGNKLENTVCKLITLFCTSLSIIFPAMAAETFQTQGHNASYFAASHIDCVTHYQFVLAARESSRAGGAETTREILYISEYYFDTCSNVELGGASGLKNLGKHEFEVRNGYSRIITTIEMVDSTTGNVGHRAVDLTWLGLGDARQGTFVNQYGGPGYKIITRFSGVSEPATVIGSIGELFVNVAGNLDTIRAGSVTIDKR